MTFNAIRAGQQRMAFSQQANERINQSRIYQQQQQNNIWWSNWNNRNTQISYESFQRSTSSSPNTPHVYTYTGREQEGDHLRVNLWLLAEGLAMIIVIPSTLCTLSSSVACITASSILGCFGITTATACCYFSRYERIQRESPFNSTSIPGQMQRDLKSCCCGFQCCCKSESPDSVVNSENTPLVPLKMEKESETGCCNFGCIRAIVRNESSGSVESSATARPKVQKMQDKLNEENVDPIRLEIKFKDQTFLAKITLTTDGKDIGATEKNHEIERQKKLYSGMLREIAKLHEPDYKKELGMLKGLTHKGFIFENGILPHGDKTTVLWTEFIKSLHNPPK